MRLFHYALLPYLPELQFRGKLREIVAIMRDWRDKGKTNHILINKVMEYSPKELYYYFSLYEHEYLRYGKNLDRYEKEFVEFCCKHKPSSYHSECFEGWHNKEYLRVCMANLYEKHYFGVGKSRITDDEWQTLLDGYKEITGEDYVI